MSSSITIKRNNHWLYHCEASQKNEMLTQLITEYAQMSILIAVSNLENFELEAFENVTLKSDDQIIDTDLQHYDLVIHAQLPVNGSDYMKRLECAKELSIGLLLTKESQLLYNIEQLLGRTIAQKYLEGFEPVKIIKEESPYREKKKFEMTEGTQKPRQRNHHKDGKNRTDEERKEYQVRRAKSGKNYKSYQDKKEGFDKKRSFDKKRDDRNSDNKSAKPNREPRTFTIKTSKKGGDK